MWREKNPSFFAVFFVVYSIVYILDRYYTNTLAASKRS